ncbi:MAG: RluA family pseudouridine synthase [Acholeplasmataceae bacterium]|nr:MAG: RluA family pseudouridine synthase [Acholeplasmataceae bacterium]
MSRIIKVDTASAGARLDQFLKQQMPDISRNHLQQMIKSAHVLVNDEQVKTGYALKTGDRITITYMAPKTLDLEPVDLNLDIVYEDDDLLVVNKPKGLVVHPADSHHEPTLVHGLLHQVDDLSTINSVIRPGIVHRIDKDTSGLLVVAKNDAAHQALSDALARHEVTRLYTALVYGRFQETRGMIDAPIERHPKHRRKMAVLSGGRPAITHFTVLEQYEHYALLACKLETGRTHQIRVHMAHIHHPIVGDPVYGPKQVIGKTGQFLHAGTLAFIHPTTKKQMTFTVDLPDDFQSFLSSLTQVSAS